MKLHQKGFLLIELSKTRGLWDDDIISAAMRYYGKSGDYWDKTIRIALEELAAAGLIARLQSKLKAANQKSSLTFMYALTEFGRTRMIDTGLLTEVRP